MDISVPLKCGQRLEPQDGEPFWIYFQYEKLPNFCYACGKLDHVIRECEDGDGVSPNTPVAELPFEAWLRADYLRSHAQPLHRNNTSHTKGRPRAGTSKGMRADARATAPYPKQSDAKTSGLDAKTTEFTA